MVFRFIFVFLIRGGFYFIILVYYFFNNVLGNGMVRKGYIGIGFPMKITCISTFRAKHVNTHKRSVHVLIPHVALWVPLIRAVLPVFAQWSLLQEEEVFVMFFVFVPVPRIMKTPVSKVVPVLREHVSACKRIWAD